MASLGGATEWLDTEPLGPAELRGHVVLVNFWTWTCINWLRQEAVRPRVVAGLPNAGLVVIGGHTVANAGQNGIVGDDDSVTSGVLGASALFVLNSALAVVLFRRSKLRRLAEGTPRTLISMGVVDHEALRKERLTEDQPDGRHRDPKALAASMTWRRRCCRPKGTIVTRMKEMDRDARRFMDLTKQLDELKPMVCRPWPGVRRSAEVGVTYCLNSPKNSR
jgi:hypothetical protein